MQFWDKLRFLDKSKILRVIINRDSVCMGDDCESHKKILELSPATNVKELFRLLSSYIPHMDNSVWVIKTQRKILGFIIIETSGDLISEIDDPQERLGNKLDEIQITCLYYPQGAFTLIDGKTGEHIEKYAECSTLLAKVKRSMKFSGNGIRFRHYQNFNRLKTGSVCLSVGCFGTQIYALEHVIGVADVPEYHRISKEEYDEFDIWRKDPNRLKEILGRKVFCSGHADLNMFQEDFIEP